MPRSLVPPPSVWPTRCNSTYTRAGYSGRRNGRRRAGPLLQKLRIFFFSSRRRHTRCLSDWSSDVCSSDLLKHFAGHGQPEGGRNIAPVNYSEREFRSVHPYPFEMAVKAAHAHALMASYNEWDRVPNHVNHRLLTDILRTEWGFDGFVMSDGGGIESVVDEHHAAAGYAEAGIL